MSAGLQTQSPADELSGLLAGMDEITNTITNKIMVAIPATELERGSVTDREFFARRIRYRLLASVEAVLEIGDTLIEAKAQLPHGEFEAMVRDDLGWSPPTARRFMAIACHPVLQIAHTVRDCPRAGGRSPSCRVDPPKLEKAIAMVLVRPDMTRNDTRRVVGHELLTDQEYNHKKYRTGRRGKAAAACTRGGTAACP